MFGPRFGPCKICGNVSLDCFGRLSGCHSRAGPGQHQRTAPVGRCERLVTMLAQALRRHAVFSVHGRVTSVVAAGRRSPIKVRSQNSCFDMSVTSFHGRVSPSTSDMSPLCCSVASLPRAVHPPPPPVEEAAVELRQREEALRAARACDRYRALLTAEHDRWVRGREELHRPCARFRVSRFHVCLHLWGSQWQSATTTT